MAHNSFDIVQEVDLPPVISGLSDTMLTLSGNVSTLYNTPTYYIDYKQVVTSGVVTNNYVTSFTWSNLANASAVTGSFSGTIDYVVDFGGTYHSTNAARFLEFRLLTNGVEIANDRKFLNLPTSGTQQYTDFSWYVTGVTSGSVFQVQSQKNTVTVFSTNAVNQFFTIYGSYVI